LRITRYLAELDWTLEGWQPHAWRSGLHGVNLPSWPAVAIPARVPGSVQQSLRDANLLRVWGGAVLERSVFYELCDEMGLMVWQDLPLSSSGYDNWPPEDQPTIDLASRITASYIERRQHHPSLILWCGGNELQAAPGRCVGIGTLAARNPSIPPMTSDDRPRRTTQPSIDRTN